MQLNCKSPPVLKSPKKIFLLATALASLGRLTATESDYDYSGVFAKDNDVVSEFFTVGSKSKITVFSSTWFSASSPTGFDPILAVWGSSGKLINELDDGELTGTTFSNGIGYDHGNFDSFFHLLLPAGTYRATIAQYDNYAAPSDIFSAGFVHDGAAGDHFKSDFGGRTGDWSFHVLVKSVPDSGSSLVLLALGLGGIGAARRFKRKA